MLVPELIPESSYLRRMADGTIKQINPFTGTEVWTVPGRAGRPIGSPNPNAIKPIDRHAEADYCDFCEARYLRTPPEKARLVRDGNEYRTLRDVAAGQLFDTRAEFRRLPNLFEIISFDYWAKNHNYSQNEAIERRKAEYMAEAAGHSHVLDILAHKLKLLGMSETDLADLALDERLKMSNSFFGGGHELIVARHHYAPGAQHQHELASSGSFTPEEHYQYFRFTIEAMRDLYLTNRYVRYVVVFQNWLKAAGASFDHLHKQLVAIDTRGASNEMEIRQARANPNIYNEAAVNYAGYRNLVFAENDHAIAFAGFGHRFPTLEIYSKAERSQPWNHSEAELRAVSDLVHACHAAMGPGIPCNEEWHYKPPDADVAMPWRVQIKWRISNPAGFEGGTMIYVNTIDPETLRDKVVPRLFQLKNEGRIAPMKIAFECACVPNCLKYNPAVRREDKENPAFPPFER